MHLKGIFVLVVSLTLPFFTAIYSKLFWGAKMLKAVQSFYVDNRVCVKIVNEVSDLFSVKIWVCQRCIMSPGLFSLYMGGLMQARALGK